MSSKSIGLLQERMLSFEQSMTEIRKCSQTSHMDGLASRQDTWVDNSDDMLKALKHARSAVKTIDDLRLENERLRQRLECNTGATFNNIDDEGSGTAVATTSTIPSEGSSIKAKKKRSYTRRKIGTDKLGVEASTNTFGIERDQDESSHLGSLVALRKSLRLCLKGHHRTKNTCQTARSTTTMVILKSIPHETRFAVPVAQERPSQH